MTTTPPTPTSAAEPLWRQLAKQADLEAQYDVLLKRGTWTDKEVALHMARFAEARIFALADRHVDAVATKLKESEAEWQRQVAELQSQLDAARAGQWAPVEDGYIHKHQLSTGRVLSWMQVVGTIIKTSDSIHLTATELPDNVRLCRLQPASAGSEGTVQDG